jgi:hypothetical protein
METNEVSMLTDHVEKLVLHLGKANEAKLNSERRTRDMRRECSRVRHVIDKQQIGLAVHQRLILELRETSGILETQLSTMDEAYLYLKSKIGALIVEVDKAKQASKQSADKGINTSSLASDTLQSNFSSNGLSAKDINCARPVSPSPDDYSDTSPIIDYDAIYGGKPDRFGFQSEVCEIVIAEASRETSKPGNSSSGSSSTSSNSSSNSSYRKYSSNVCNYEFDFIYGNYDAAYQSGTKARKRRSQRALRCQGVSSPNFTTDKRNTKVIINYRTSR